MSLRNRATSARRRLAVYARVLTDVVRFRLDGGATDVVYLDLHDPLFNKRYTYLFIKFLLLGGHTVVLRYRGELVLRFNDLKYTGLILTEDRLLALPFEVDAEVSIGDRPNAGKRIHMDYFADRNDTSAYVIPMTMHPLFYHRGTWNRPVDPGERAASVVFAGNVGEDQYGDSTDLRRFGMRSRHEQIERIGRSGVLDVRERLEVGVGPDGGAPGGGIDDGVVYLLDREFLDVGFDGWREFLARFHFFLALPGKVMPLCHNVVEAMSVGTVPVIHEEYASLFTPPLRDGEEAVTYTEETLVERLETALGLGLQEASRMSARTREYYETHLVPEAVARRITSDEVSELRLCGEGDSVRLMEGGAAG